MRSILSVLSVLSVQLVVQLSRAAEQPPSVADFDWKSLPPSESISWAACYGSLQCARLSVPLNYSVPQGDMAAIAIIKVPSQAAVGEPSYHGPLFFNPGGPGVSGIEFVLSNAAAIEPFLPNFDFVSFDPRGVGVSTPTISLFKTDSDRSAWDFTANGVDINSTLPSLQIPRLWALSQTVGQLAKDKDNGLLAHVTTDNVARDLLSMSQAMNQTKVQYYGISYGTNLGATFATMFPDKIQRMILDGVVNPTLWYSGDWAKTLTDTDKALHSFFDECYSAGPDACAFYASSPSKIAEKLDRILDSVKTAPVPVSFNGSYGLVDYGTVRGTMLAVLYAPYPGFLELADALAALEKGDGSLIFQVSRSGNVLVGTPCNSESTDNSVEALMGISCSDIVNSHATAAQLLKYYKDNIHISSFLNEYLQLTISCAGWQFQPKHFTGPIGGNTSFPIMFIGNTRDPVTPLVGAVSTSQVFPGSGLLTLDTTGHTSFAAPSACVGQHILQYLVNGTLPQKNSLCKVDKPPFASGITKRMNLRAFPRL